MTEAKRFLNKRTAVIATALAAAAVIAAGTTNAWFTSKVDASLQSVEMGRLKVVSSFLNEDDDSFYEPGVNVDKSGTLENAGSIPSFVKVAVNPTVIIKSDANGNPVTPTTIENDPNIKPEFDADKLGYKFAGDDCYFWYTDNDGNYYVLMNGAIESDVAMEIKLDGSVLGNQYQGAEIYLSGEWKATQALPDAIKDELNVNFDELVFIPNEIDNTRRSRSYMTPEQAEAMARAIVERGAEQTEEVEGE